MISGNIKKRFYTSLILLTLIILIFKYDFILIFSLIILGIFSILEFFNISKKLFRKKLYLISSNIFFTIYVFIFCFMFIFFSNFVQLKIILYILLLGCVASDIGGYIFGKIIKGPKLTKISPNKTIAGSIGSFILTSMLISGLFFYLTKNFSLNIIVVSVLTSFGCQLGDILFSFLKRRASLKDTGNLLPGHGGALDRLDGIFVGLPIGFLSLVLIY